MFDLKTKANMFVALRENVDHYKIKSNNSCHMSVLKAHSLFNFRGKGLHFVDSYVYTDVKDAFEREPMVARFSYNGFG